MDLLELDARGSINHHDMHMKLKRQQNRKSHGPSIIPK